MHLRYCFHSKPFFYQKTENRFPSSTPIPPKTTIYPGANVTARMVRLNVLHSTVNAEGISGIASTLRYLFQMMPFLMEIPQALEVGQTITIKGIFSPHGDRYVMYGIWMDRHFFRDHNVTSTGCNELSSALQPMFQSPD